MHIGLLCATRRGYRFLEKLLMLEPHARCTVFSFREEHWEPLFLDDIRTLASHHGADFFEEKYLGQPQWESFWQTTSLDLLLVVSWRYLIPTSVYQKPRGGTFVFHDSLLPTYRGFAPTVWSIINGEDHTGVTLFEIAENVDDGPIVDQQRVPIGPDDTIAEVLERTTEVYLELLERNLPALLAGTAPRRPQENARATYTCKRLPEDNRIDWSQPARKIHDLVRAVTFPYPGAYTSLNGQTLRVWSASLPQDGRRYVGGVPGRVVEVLPGDAGVVVMTGDGPLLLRQVQLDRQELRRASDILNKLSYTLGR
jgi:methionyl-tRNA formyltransferase